MRQKLPGVRKNKVREKSGSYEYVIPRDAGDELNLEHGEVPEEVAVDLEKREITLSFE
ncbi:hypothetical protein [Salinibaculum salinum]|uniref:hypothetical protein n=1 Tax=Salinibaculum salinum TaxID=3131996 RepID=UPI0030EB4CB9